MEAQLTRNDSLLRALQSSSESRVEALQCSHNILWGKYCRLLDSMYLLGYAVDRICDCSDATRVQELVLEAMQRLPYDDLPNPRPQTYQYGPQNPARSTASSSTAGHRAASGSSEPAASTASGTNIPQLHTIFEEHRWPPAFSKAAASSPPLSRSADLESSPYAPGVRQPIGSPHAPGVRDIRGSAATPKPAPATPRAPDPPDFSWRPFRRRNQQSSSGSGRVDPRDT